MLGNEALQRVASRPFVLPWEYWQEADGSWAAAATTMSLCAVAPTLQELVMEVYEVLDEYWAILREKRDTLSDDLRELLNLRPYFELKAG
jgi:hypothetical protein